MKFIFPTLFFIVLCPLLTTAWLPTWEKMDVDPDDVEEDSALVMANYCGRRCDKYNNLVVKHNYCTLPECFPCDCNEHCSKKGTCCPSVKPTESEQEQGSYTPINLTQMEEYFEGIYSRFECKNTASPDMENILLVATCPESWMNDENITKKCENPTEDSFQSITPYIDEYSGITFANIFCAYCNGFIPSVPDWYDLETDLISGSNQGGNWEIGGLFPTVPGGEDSNSGNDTSLNIIPPQNYTNPSTGGEQTTPNDSLKPDTRSNTTTPQTDFRSTTSMTSTKTERFDSRMTTDAVIDREPGSEFGDFFKSTTLSLKNNDSTDSKSSTQNFNLLTGKPVVTERTTFFSDDYGDSFQTSTKTPNTSTDSTTNHIQLATFRSETQTTLNIASTTSFGIVESEYTTKNFDSGTTNNPLAGGKDSNDTVDKIKDTLNFMTSSTNNIDSPAPMQSSTTKDVQASSTTDKDTASVTVETEDNTQSTTYLLINHTDQSHDLNSKTPSEINTSTISEPNLHIESTQNPSTTRIPKATLDTQTTDAHLIEESNSERSDSSSDRMPILLSTTNVNHGHTGTTSTPSATNANSNQSVPSQEKVTTGPDEGTGSRRKRGVVISSDPMNDPNVPIANTFLTRDQLYPEKFDGPQIKHSTPHHNVLLHRIPLIMGCEDYQQLYKIDDPFQFFKRAKQLDGCFFRFQPDNLRYYKTSITKCPDRFLAPSSLSPTPKCHAKAKKQYQNACYELPQLPGLRVSGHKNLFCGMCVKKNPTIVVNKNCQSSYSKQEAPLGSFFDVNYIDAKIKFYKRKCEEFQCYTNGRQCAPTKMLYPGLSQMCRPINDGINGLGYSLSVTLIAETYVNNLNADKLAKVINYTLPIRGIAFTVTIHRCLDQVNGLRTEIDIIGSMQAPWSEPRYRFEFDLVMNFADKNWYFSNREKSQIVEFKPACLGQELCGIYRQKVEACQIERQTFWSTKGSPKPKDDYIDLNPTLFCPFYSYDLIEEIDVSNKNTLNFKIIHKNGTLVVPWSKHVSLIDGRVNICEETDMEEMTTSVFKHNEMIFGFVSGGIGDRILARPPPISSNRFLTNLTEKQVLSNQTDDTIITGDLILNQLNPNLTFPGIDDNKNDSIFTSRLVVTPDPSTTINRNTSNLWKSNHTVDNPTNNASFAMEVGNTGYVQRPDVFQNSSEIPSLDKNENGLNKGSYLYNSGIFNTVFFVALNWLALFYVV